MPRELKPARTAPPIHYDGRLYWFTEWFDPEDDRCSWCLGPIGEDEVPLMLFKDVGAATWQARVCEACTPLVVRLLV